MTQFSIGFSEKLAEVASNLVKSEGDNQDARQVVTYLSRVSMEISLKALLERAHFPIDEIRRCGHDFDKLLTKVYCCQVKPDCGTDSVQWVSAACLRDIDVKSMFGPIKLGDIINVRQFKDDLTQSRLASEYPNQIRYGNDVRDVYPEALSLAAAVLNSWVKENIESVRQA